MLMRFFSVQLGTKTKQKWNVAVRRYGYGAKCVKDHTHQEQQE